MLNKITCFRYIINLKLSYLASTICLKVRRLDLLWKVSYVYFFSTFSGTIRHSRQSKPKLMLRMFVLGSEGENDHIKQIYNFISPQHGVM